MHVCMSAVDVQHVGHCPLHAQGHVGHKQACQHYPSDQLVRRPNEAVPLHGIPACSEVCCSHPHLLRLPARALYLLVYRAPKQSPLLSTQADL